MMEVVTPLEAPRAGRAIAYGSRTGTIEALPDADPPLGYQFDHIIAWDAGGVAWVLWLDNHNALVYDQTPSGWDGRRMATAHRTYKTWLRD
jgi:hypothetical protein